ncbi:TdeIII family type II restriction endonuclease [Xanthovirga aplysinae]|uniref:TdeIII family type II restriction endonuclease n=1 Tax=Xanthovirga aplysinae TaxID=2529853 RepID=UPI0012BC8AD5|nr:TdeIII family type II restriction endonuclease [Xanthovirga aplysinae]MTI29455.1 TdeIII family type II restriction endonuclease [Xanthovirga aplysinae]
MEKKYQDAIAFEFQKCIEDTIYILFANSNRKRSLIDPFKKTILSKEILFWIHFEKVFNKSFNKNHVGKISKYLLLANGAEKANVQKSSIITLSKEEITNIKRHISLLALNKLNRKPCWTKDLRSVKVHQPIRNFKLKITTDLWFEKKDVETFIYLFGGKPSKGQLIQAKENLLQLKLAYPHCTTLIALYHNPFGKEKETYRYNPPFEVFDILNDDNILIGKKYWDTIGGEGSYEQVLEISRNVRKSYLNKVEELIKEFEIFGSLPTFDTIQ